MSVKNLAKANIHVHANSMSPNEVTRELALDQGLSLPTSYIDVDGSPILGPGHAGFQRAYGARAALINKPGDLRRAVHGGLVLDAQHGGIYAQILSSGQNGYDPYLDFTDKDKLYRALHTTFVAIREGIDGACRQTGIQGFLSVAIKRRSIKPFPDKRMVELFGDNPPKELGGLEMAHAQLGAFERFKKEMGKDADFVTGFNMDGNETFEECRAYQPVYQRAADLGLAGSCHVGEQLRDGNGIELDCEDVWQAVNLPGIISVSHFLRAIRDKKLMQAVLDKEILIEQLPTINEILTPELVGTPTKHPLPEYHAFGLKLALGSDVPGITGDHIGKVYEKAAEYGLTDEDLIQITYNGCAYGFAAPEVKPKLIQRVYDYAAENGLSLPPEKHVPRPAQFHAQL